MDGFNQTLTLALSLFIRKDRGIGKMVKIEITASSVEEAKEILDAVKYIKEWHKDQIEFHFPETDSVSYQMPRYTVGSSVCGAASVDYSKLEPFNFDAVHTNSKNGILDFFTTQFSKLINRLR